MMTRMRWLWAVGLVAMIGVGRLCADDTTERLDRGKGDWVLAEMGIEANAGLLRLKKDRECGKKAAADVSRLRALLERSPKEPAMLEAATEHVLWSFYGEKGLSRSAPQVSQLADEALVRLALIQVQQNQRMIGLLEQLTAREQAKKEGGTR